MTFRELHLNVKIRLLQNFIGNMIGSMVFPFLAIYFAEAIGPSLTGLLIVLHIAITVSAGAYGGHFADKFGRKRVKLYAETARVLLFAVVALSNSPWYESAVVTCIGMLLIGFCDGLSGPASEAMLIDVTTSKSRTLVYSVDYWSNNFGLVIGGIAGGYLFRSFKFELFSAMTLFLALSLVVLIVWITETKPESKPLPAGEKPAGMVATYMTVFKNRIFIIFLGAALLCGSLENITNNYGRVRLFDDISTPQTIFTLGSWVFTADGLQLFAFLQAMNAMIVVLFSAVVRKWVHRFGHRRALLLGVALSTIGYAVIIVSNWPLVLGISMIIATIGEITWVPVKQTILADLAPTENRGVYMAVAGLTGVGSSMLGGLSITLGAYVSSWTMFALFLVVGMLSLFFYARTMNSLSRRTKVPAQPEVSV
ncbi:DHA1 family multidrug resistance protein B-like MFS transporter [Tumebacillus permanentifrigoris]|uniref:DHA1 family multidrug resistance protein B-like MFS transporter n=1 Tax=Tumebacillus permanentifrigoris TaxID=378543 RepID=A0A316D5X6_9BACL|nr:DHA1 family multidrug resistance protein B-like MFS transporter [Tumebacillus permanentifrigoris]